MEEGGAGEGGVPVVEGLEGVVEVDDREEGVLEVVGAVQLQQQAEEGGLAVALVPQPDEEGVRGCHLLGLAEVDEGGEGVGVLLELEGAAVEGVAGVAQPQVALDELAAGLDDDLELLEERGEEGLAGGVVGGVLEVVLGLAQRVHEVQVDGGALLVVAGFGLHGGAPVSYTHLTLPTN